MPFIAQQLSADGVSQDGRVVLATAVLLAITEDHVATLAVNAGGTGYAVGDTFRLNTGTTVTVNGDSFHATGRVTSVSAGVVTGVELVSAGAYTTLPGLTANATVTLTGAGSGLTLDLTTQVALWSEDSRTNLDNVDFQTDGDWLCTSSKTSNPPTVGMRSSISAANDAVQLLIATSFDNGLPWRDQPGNPPTSDFWLGVPNQDPFVYISTTERRVNITITDGTFKQYGGTGLFLPDIDIASNYPFPGIVHAQSTAIRAFNEAYNASNRGICNPIDFSGLGCYQYRNNQSTEWFGITFDNNLGLDTCRAQMWPAQGERSRWSFNKAPVPTNGVGGVDANDMTPGADANGATVYSKIYGSFNEDDWLESDSDADMPQGVAPQGLGSQLHFTIENLIISNQPSDVQQIGQIDGFESVHGRGLSAFDEIESASGQRFIVFQDTNDPTRQNWVAMEIV